MGSHPWAGSQCPFLYFSLALSVLWMLNKSRIGLYQEGLIGYYYKLLETPCISLWFCVSSNLYSPVFFLFALPYIVLYQDE